MDVFCFSEVILPVDRMTDLRYRPSILDESEALRWLAFGLAVTFVFRLLAARYESWLLPLAVVLIVPMCILAEMRIHPGRRAVRVCRGHQEPQAPRQT